MAEKILIRVGIAIGIESEKNTDFAALLTKLGRHGTLVREEPEKHGRDGVDSDSDSDPEENSIRG